MSYKKLRLTDFLESGEYHSVLFKFYHGLGDAISFYCNVLPVLEKKFPDVGKLRAEIIDNSLSARKIYERMAEMEE